MGIGASSSGVCKIPQTTAYPLPGLAGALRGGGINRVWAVLSDNKCLSEIGQVGLGFGKVLRKPRAIFIWCLAGAPWHPPSGGAAQG